MGQVRPRENVDSSLIDESGRAAIQWMVAMTSGDMTEGQLRDFDRWRNADPANGQAWERMSGGLQPFDALARSGLPRGSLSRTPPVARRNRRTVLAGLAGLAAVGGAGMAAQRFVPLEDLLTDHYTKTAELDRFHLGDDSEIVLAPRSSINVGMTRETRGLELVRGKVMLDIAEKDPRPFTIDLGRLRLDASEGAFVLNRRDDRVVTVSSLRGHGTLRSESGRRLAIGARERLVFDGADIVRSAIDVDAASSWVSGFSVARDETVASIVEEIRPYYPGFIRLGADAGARHATGVFNLVDPVAALSALAQSVGLEMTRTAGFWIRIARAGT